MPTQTAIHESQAKIKLLKIFILKIFRHFEVRGLSKSSLFTWEFSVSGSNAPVLTRLASSFLTKRFEVAGGSVKTQFNNVRTFTDATQSELILARQ